MVKRSHLETFATMTYQEGIDAFWAAIREQPVLHRGDMNHVGGMIMGRFCSSWRTNLIFRKNPECAGCGLKIAEYGLHRHLSTSCAGHKKFIMAWGIRNGNYVAFTRDHIIPQGKGGPDTFENVQLMCGPCNLKKGTENNNKFIEKRRKQFHLPPHENVLQSLPGLAQFFVSQPCLSPSAAPSIYGSHFQDTIVP